MSVCDAIYAQLWSIVAAVNLLGNFQGKMGRSHSSAVLKRKKLYISYNDSIETVSFTKILNNLH